MSGMFGWFWSESVWLPPNTTWADLAHDPKSNIQHTDSNHLWYPIPMGFGLLILRFILERYWFAPVGIALGIKNIKPKKAPPNQILEKAYNTHKQVKFKVVQGLAKQLDWTDRQVERWLRLRRNQDKPSTLTKFCENAWRCLYYTYSFTYGMVILWEKDFLWDLEECWRDYPHQSISNDIWWYYMISMSFYYSLMVSQFFDVKRKDFWQMFIHHIATISLMSFSWLCNLYRVGALVLVVHDCADIFMEAAKMAKYANYQKFCDIIFGVFTLTWIITRIGLFPFWLIYGTMFRAPRIVPMFPAYYIFNTLLLLLLALHIFWTYLILKIAYKALHAGQMEGDIRSSSSIDSDISQSQ